MVGFLRGATRVGAEEKRERGPAGKENPKVVSVSKLRSILAKHKSDDPQIIGIGHVLPSPNCGIDSKAGPNVYIKSGIAQARGLRY